MSNSLERNKFGILPTIEKRPFENPSMRFFFTKWCEINDSIVTKIVDRESWETKRISGLLEKRSDGKQTLSLPIDLQLWEMVGVMEVVDHDTFANNTQRQNEKKDKLVALGRIFQNSGIYITKRLDTITEGKEIASALAEEFYEYGLSLENGNRSEHSPTKDAILSRDLTAEEINAVDRFLAGENLFKSRQSRSEKLTTSDTTKRDDLYEPERQKTLAQFFRVAQKAFELKLKTKNDELTVPENDLNPWQNDTPIHNAFLAKIEHAITKQINTPEHELVSSIFRRGMQNLAHDMRERGWRNGINSLFEKIGINLHVEQRKLADVLNISQLRIELDDTRKHDNANNISLKEREIADIIQEAVSGFPYKSRNNNPAEIVATQHINCVGASTLGGALMKEAGLHYLVGSVPEHSILFLVTTDGSVEWRDILYPQFNKKLKDDMIVGKAQDGSPLTVADIVEFSHNPKPEGLMFDIDSHKYRDMFPWVNDGQRQFVAVFEPEYGQQIHVLNNIARSLFVLGNYEASIKGCKQAIAMDPNDPYPYNGLGNALNQRGHYKEAIVEFKKAIAIDSKDSAYYYGLGNALNNDGRYEEAIKAYQKFIYLADKQEHGEFIKLAEKSIAELKDKIQ